MEACNYDVVKSFGGKLYKGINYDNGTFYYNCDNGILVQKLIIQNGYGTVTKIQTDTLLITSGPIGTRWGLFNQNMNNPLINALTGTDLSVSNGGGDNILSKKRINSFEEFDGRWLFIYSSKLFPWSNLQSLKLTE